MVGAHPLTRIKANLSPRVDECRDKILRDQERGFPLVARGVLRAALNANCRVASCCLFYRITKKVKIK